MNNTIVRDYSQDKHGMHVCDHRVSLLSLIQSRERDGGGWWRWGWVIFFLKLSNSASFTVKNGFNRDDRYTLIMME